jgi:hypothetical protein
MATGPTSVDVPVRLVMHESDDGASRQREMADHVRDTGLAWLRLDYLDTLPTVPDPTPKD